MKIKLRKIPWTFYTVRWNLHGKGGAVCRHTPWAWGGCALAVEPTHAELQHAARRGGCTALRPPLGPGDPDDAVRDGAPQHNGLPEPEPEDDDEAEASAPGNLRLQPWHPHTHTERERERERERGRGREGHRQKRHTRTHTHTHRGREGAARLAHHHLRAERRKRHTERARARQGAVRLVRRAPHAAG